MEGEEGGMKGDVLAFGEGHGGGYNGGGGRRTKDKGLTISRSISMMVPLTSRYAVPLRSR